MADVAPELLDKVTKDFNARMAADGNIKAIQKRIAEGVATSEDISLYSMQVGDHAAEALQANLTAGALPNGNLYYNIADRVVMPQLIDNYNLVEDIAEQIQLQLNQAAGIGLQPTRVGMNMDRATGLIDALTKDPERGIDAVRWLLDEPVKNYTQSVVDEFVRENAKSQASAGLSAKIERRVYGGCCDWCRGLAGVYEYGDEPSDFYRKHEECRCIILFTPSKQRRGKGMVQNAHTKEWYNSSAEAFNAEAKGAGKTERVKAAKAEETKIKRKAATAKDNRTQLQKDMDEIIAEARKKKAKALEANEGWKQMQERQKQLRIEAQMQLEKMRQSMAG